MILPTGGANHPLVQISTCGAASYGYEFFGDVPNHLLWFTVYSSTNTLFLDTTAADQEQRFLIGGLIYVTKDISRISGRNAASRFFVQLVCVGVADDRLSRERI